MTSRGSPTRYNQYILRARDHEKEREYDKALSVYKLARGIHEDYQLNEKIKKLTAKVGAYEREFDPKSCKEQSDGYVRNEDTGNYILGKLVIPGRVYEALFNYQRVGVKWMWEHFHDRHTGCVLADDMGLGKTMQSVTFVSSLFYSYLIRTVLIVVPQTLLEQWKEEFDGMSPEVEERVVILHSQKGKQREEILRRIEKRGGVVITTYGMILHNERLFILGRTWDILMLDEGHIVKNHRSKTTMALSRIPTRFRLVISGTPVQNNLMELWAVMNFVCRGELLGEFGPFVRNFVKPITEGQKDGRSTDTEALARTVFQLVHPFIIRREKKEVFKQIENAPTLTDKVDVVVWLQLTPMQEKIYSEFLGTEEVRRALNQSNSPLAAITVIMKICNSPRLLLSGGGEATHLVKEYLGSDHAMTQDSLIAISTKIKTLFDILENLQKEEENHRVTIFSMSLVMLDMIEFVALERGMRYVRLDGGEKSHEMRKNMIDRFNSDNSIFLFLLSTRVGGFGINLVGADRAIIMEPGWNPSVISQSIDRIHRIGQKRKVVVFRLLTAGTVEETMYNRQIFKDALTDLVVRERIRDQYFSKDILGQIFSLGDTSFSNTHQTFVEKHPDWENGPPSSIARVVSSDSVVGIHDHRVVILERLSEAATNKRAEELAEGALRRIIASTPRPIRPEKGKLHIESDDEDEEEHDNLDDLIEVIANVSLDGALGDEMEQEEAEKERNTPTSNPFSQPETQFIALGATNDAMEDKPKISLAEKARELNIAPPSTTKGVISTPISDAEHTISPVAIPDISHGRIIDVDVQEDDEGSDEDSAVFHTPTNEYQSTTPFANVSSLTTLLQDEYSQQNALEERTGARKGDGSSINAENDDVAIQGSSPLSELRSPPFRTPNVIQEERSQPTQLHFTQVTKNFKYFSKSRVKDSSASNYNDLIRRMEELEDLNPLEALRCCMDALAITDSNPALQMKAISLSHRLELWNGNSEKDDI